MIRNPNEPIRSAYIQALGEATGLNVWHNRVPLNVKPIPNQYIILDSQTKNETVNAKSSDGINLYFEWLCTIDVNCYNINPKGYSDASVVDNIEQTVISIIRKGIAIPEFSNKNTSILESQELDSETSTQSIDRRLIKFEHWLDRTEFIENGTIYAGGSASVPITESDVLALTYSEVPGTITFTFQTGLNRILTVAVPDTNTISVYDETSDEDLTGLFSAVSMTINGISYSVFTMQNALPFTTNHIIKVTVL